MIRLTKSDAIAYLTDVYLEILIDQAIELRWKVRYENRLP